jgi:hypothetical protein
MTTDPLGSAVGSLSPARFVTTRTSSRSIRTPPTTTATSVNIQRRKRGPIAMVGWRLPLSLSLSVSLSLSLSLSMLLGYGCFSFLFFFSERIGLVFSDKWARVLGAEEGRIYYGVWIFF